MSVRVGLGLATVGTSLREIATSVVASALAETEVRVKSDPRRRAGRT
jgi:hypothetical protein